MKNAISGNYARVLISIFISNIPRTINFCQKDKIVIRDVFEHEGVLKISHDGLPKELHVEDINRTTEFLESHHFTGFFFQALIIKGFIDGHFR